MRFMNTNYCTETSTVVTASTEAPSYLASNLQNPLRSKSWRSTAVASESVVFDFQTTEAMDSVVIMWPLENGIRLTDTATIRIQANATNVWTTPSVNQLLTINNDYSLASHYFATDQSYRYWRVLITDPGNPWGYIEVGQVWIGKALSIQNAENGFKFSINDPSKITMNNYGHRYVDEYPSRNRLEVSYSYLEYAEVQILENAYRVNGVKKPVLMILDPEAVVFNKDHFVLYGLMGSQFGLSHVTYNLFNSDGMGIEELG